VSVVVESLGDDVIAVVDVVNLVLVDISSGYI